MRLATILHFLTPILPWLPVVHYCVNTHEIIQSITDTSIGATLFVMNMATGNYIVYSTFEHLWLGMLCIVSSRCLAHFLHNLSVPFQETNNIYIAYMLYVEFVFALARAVLFFVYLQHATIAVNPYCVSFFVSTEYILTYISFNLLVTRHWEMFNLGTMVVVHDNAKTFNWIYFVHLSRISHILSWMLSLLSALLLLGGHLDLGVNDKVQQQLHYEKEITRHVKQNRKMVIEIATTMEENSKSILHSNITILFFCFLYFLTLCVSIIPKFSLAYDNRASRERMPIYATDPAIPPHKLSENTRQQFEHYFPMMTTYILIGHAAILVLLCVCSVYFLDIYQVFTCVFAFQGINLYYLYSYQLFYKWVEQMLHTAKSTNMYFSYKKAVVIHDALYVMSRYLGYLGFVVGILSIVKFFWW